MSLVQFHHDYGTGSLVLAPNGTKYELEAQKGPHRAFSLIVKGFDGLNYWDRKIYKTQKYLEEGEVILIVIM